MTLRTSFRKVAVLMGGRSAEREVSLKTGQAILRALCEIGYSAYSIDVDMDVAEILLKDRPDVAFIALHGRYGEDGTVQGLLELLEIPYPGSGVLASALAMDKIMSKKIFRQENIPVAADVACFAKQYMRDEKASIARIIDSVPLPVIVKPSREGSTIGMTVVEQPDRLKKAMEEAFDYDERVLVEQFVPGRLLTSALIGTTPRALPLVEIKAKSGFYDYEAKYSTGKTDYICPADIPATTTKLIQKISVDSHIALGCEDVSRIDFILDEEGNIVVLEVNTLPGMTETSLVPKAAKAAGIEFPDLVEEILSGASLKLVPER